MPLRFTPTPRPWRHRLRITNPGEGWFKRLRRYLADHSEQVLGCFLLAAEHLHR